MKAALIHGCGNAVETSMFSLTLAIASSMQMHEYIGIPRWR